MTRHARCRQRRPDGLRRRFAHARRDRYASRWFRRQREPRDRPARATSPTAGPCPADAPRHLSDGVPRTSLTQLTRRAGPDGHASWSRPRGELPDVQDDAWRRPSTRRRRGPKLRSAEIGDVKARRAEILVSCPARRRKPGGLTERRAPCRRQRYGADRARTSTGDGAVARRPQRRLRRRRRVSATEPRSRPRRARRTRCAPTRRRPRRVPVTTVPAGHVTNLPAPRVDPGATFTTRPPGAFTPGGATTRSSRRGDPVPASAS